MGTPWKVRYARTSDGIDIAYAISGDGPSDVVLIHGFTTHLDFIGDSPWHAYWTRRLAQHFRVIQLDKRGTGLSDRDLGHGSIEDRMRDVLAVMDAASSSKASIVGVSEGGPISLAFTATYPERVQKVVLYGTFDRLRWAPDHPVGVPDEVSGPVITWITDTWGSGQAFATLFMNHAPDPEAAIRTMAKFERNACTPQMAGEINRRNIEIDVRSLLPSISVPTLVMHNVHDPLIPVGIARQMAAHIPGAEYEEGDDDFHCTWVVKEFEPLMDRAMTFLRDAPVAAAHAPVVPPTRSIATVLFTDIVGSTEHAVSLGDARWRSVLDQHERVARSATTGAGGRVVKLTGDGVLALFDGPSRAVEAAQNMRAGARDLELDLRAGIHTGEIERSKGDVSGIGVHIAARVMGLAGAGEILASRTVKDLTAGSGIEFREHGRHRLKGVPDDWEIYAVGPRP